MADTGEDGNFDKQDFTYQSLTEKQKRYDPGGAVPYGERLDVLKGDIMMDRGAPSEMESGIMMDGKVPFVMGEDIMMDGEVPYRMMGGEMMYPDVPFGMEGDITLAGEVPFGGGMMYPGGPFGMDGDGFVPNNPEDPYITTTFPPEHSSVTQPAEVEQLFFQFRDRVGTLFPDVLSWPIMEVAFLYGVGQFLQDPMKSCLSVYELAKYKDKFVLTFIQFNPETDKGYLENWFDTMVTSNGWLGTFLNSTAICRDHYTKKQGSSQERSPHSRKPTHLSRSSGRSFREMLKQKAKRFSEKMKELSHRMSGKGSARSPHHHGDGKWSTRQHIHDSNPLSPHHDSYHGDGGAFPEETGRGTIKPLDSNMLMDALKCLLRDRLKSGDNLGSSNLTLFKDPFMEKVLTRNPGIDFQMLGEWFDTITRQPWFSGFLNKILWRENNWSSREKTRKHIMEDKMAAIDQIMEIAEKVGIDRKGKKQDLNICLCL